MTERQLKIICYFLYEIVRAISAGTRTPMQSDYRDKVWEQAERQAERWGR